VDSDVESAAAAAAAVFSSNTERVTIEHAIVTTSVESIQLQTTRSINRRAVRVSMLWVNSARLQQQAKYDFLANPERLNSVFPTTTY